MLVFWYNRERLVWANKAYAKNVWTELEIIELHVNRCKQLILFQQLAFNYIAGVTSIDDKLLPLITPRA